jgi:predicted GIY-YIG superfamily endonuclease
MISCAPLGSTGKEFFPVSPREHGVTMLVWYEQHDTREAALMRERQNEEVESRMEASRD